MAGSPEHGDERRRSLAAATVELIIVGGSSLLFVFWVSPKYIAAGSNFGLPPALLPSICAIVIGFVAVAQFAKAMIRPAPSEPTPGRVPLVLGLIATAVIASLAIGSVGMVVGGALMTGMASALMGERRIWVLAAMTAGGAAVMYLVAWSGL